MLEKILPDPAKVIFWLLFNIPGFILLTYIAEIYRSVPFLKSCQRYSKFWGECNLIKPNIYFFVIFLAMIASILFFKIYPRIKDNKKFFNIAAGIGIVFLALYYKRLWYVLVYLIWG